MRAVPPKGWVKAIRESPGMTAAQLAGRIGVTKPRVYEIEKSELSGAISLGSLERAAHALDSQLVYAFVPKQPLQETVEQHALLEAVSRQLIWPLPFPSRPDRQGFCFRLRS